MSDDKRYRTISDWSHKIETVESVLNAGLTFDFAAVEVDPEKSPSSFYIDGEHVKRRLVDITTNGRRRRYIPIASDRIDELDVDQLLAHLKPEEGGWFFLNDEPIELSSGQRLFAYIVINILGTMRRNSLILVDEPELFLHPTLEIQFVDMLKAILAKFNSKALLATHSVVTVRKCPRIAYMYSKLPMTIWS